MYNILYRWFIISYTIYKWMHLWHNTLVCRLFFCRRGERFKKLSTFTLSITSTDRHKQTVQIISDGSTLFATHPGFLELSVSSKINLFKFEDRYDKKIRCPNIWVNTVIHTDQWNVKWAKNIIYAHSKDSDPSAFLDHSAGRISVCGLVGWAKSSLGTHLRVYSFPSFTDVCTLNNRTT